MSPESNAAAKNGTLIAAALCLLGLMASIICGRVHPDGIIHFDDLTHYLFARWAWTWPRYLLHDWGRPGFTILYFLPAGLGWGACRILSALLTAASAWLAFRLAQSWRIPAAWCVIPLCFAQPLFFQLSQTTLTETPLAFYLICSIYAADRNRWTLAAAFLSLALITRHESIVFLPVYLYFAFQSGAIRKPKSAIRILLVLLSAPLIINALAWLSGVTPSIKLFFEPRATSQYGHGGWLTYFARSMEAFGPGIMLLAMVGIPTLWGSNKSITNSEAPIRNSVGYLLSLTIVYFLIQTALRALGLYATGGYARFLVPICPLIAICALSGWHALGKEADRFSILNPKFILALSMLLLWLAMERQIVLYNQARDELAEMPQVHQAKLAIRIATAVIVLLCCWALGNPKSNIRSSLLQLSILTLIVLAGYSLIGPLKPPPEAPAIAGVKQWVEKNYPTRPMISANVWVDYVFGAELPPDRPATPTRLERAAPGTLFIWDRKFAPDDDHKTQWTQILTNSQWRLIYEYPDASREPPPKFAVFEKQVGPSS